MNKKTAFAVFQDGQTIKIAQVSLIDTEIVLEKVDKTTLSYPFYMKENKEMMEMFKASAEMGLESSLEEMIESYEKIQQEEALSGKNDLQDLLLKFPITDGLLSLNTIDQNIISNNYDSSFSKANITKKINREMLSNEEIKEKNFYSCYLVNEDQEIHASIHQGQIELFEAIKDIAKRTNLPIKFSHVNSNEITIIKFITDNYSFKENEFVLLLYIGIEIKIGLVMKGNNFVSSFHIDIIDNEPNVIRNSVFSKVILEQERLGLPISQNLLLAGEDFFINEETLNFFKVRTESLDLNFLTEFSNLNIDSSLQKVINEKNICEFLIPIQMAIDSLLNRHTIRFQTTNLIPNTLDNLKVSLKSNWKSFLLLLFIAYFLSTNIFSFVMNKSEKNQKEKQLEVLKINIEDKAKVNNKISVQIEQTKSSSIKISKNIDIINSLTGDKNQWRKILKVLSDGFSKYQTSWIESISEKNNGFYITAYTSKRKNITNIANLFDAGKIERIEQTEIVGKRMWLFNIQFEFPNIKNNMKEEN